MAHIGTIERPGDPRRTRQKISREMVRLLRKGAGSLRLNHGVMTDDRRLGGSGSSYRGI